MRPASLLTDSDNRRARVNDRQGNVRAVLSGSGSVVQRTDYYPYGLPCASTNPTANAYKFAAKELETRYALNFSHHGARLYFSDLGRFASPDPLAGNTPDTSTDLFCAANPANLIDPSGLIFKSQKFYKVLSNAVSNRITTLENDINNKKSQQVGLDKKSSEYKSITKEIKNITEQYNLMVKAKATIIQMNDDSKHIFSFRYGLPGKGHKVKRSKSSNQDGSFDVTISGENNSVYIHEITHIGQSYADGGLKFDDNGELRYAKNGSSTEDDSYAENIALMEQESYRTQFSFDNKIFQEIMSGIWNVFEIDIVSISKIISPYTNYMAYPLINKLVSKQQSE